MTALKFLLALTLTFSSSFVFAEPNIYIRSDGQFVAGGNEYARGFWWPKIYDAEEVFAGNAVAAEEYEMHKSRAKWFGILNWGAAGAAITYALAARGDNYSPAFQRAGFSQCAPDFAHKLRRLR